MAKIGKSALKIFNKIFDGEVGSSAVRRTKRTIKKDDGTEEEVTETEIRPSKKGAAAGAAAGAVIGGKVGGPGGAVVGGIIGGVVGFIFGPED